MQRVKIGCNHRAQPFWKFVVGVPLIYMPLFFTTPFVVVGIFLVKAHLTLVGGMDLKSYWRDFVPEWVSHRYTMRNQITGTDDSRFYLTKTRLFWIFNCKLYCPLSVASFRYMAYLVMIVENWWCPFNHGKKSDYSEGAIDQSFWHIYPEEVVKLSPEDRDNPIWNEAVPAVKEEVSVVKEEAAPVVREEAIDFPVEDWDAPISLDKDEPSE